MAWFLTASIVAVLIAVTWAFIAHRRRKEDEEFGGHGELSEEEEKTLKNLLKEHGLENIEIGDLKKLRSQEIKGLLLEAEEGKESREAVASAQRGDKKAGAARAKKSKELAKADIKNSKQIGKTLRKIKKDNLAEIKRLKKEYTFVKKELKKATKENNAKAISKHQFILAKTMQRRSEKEQTLDQIKKMIDQHKNVQTRIRSKYAEESELEKDLLSKASQNTTIPELSKILADIQAVSAQERQIAGEATQVATEDAKIASQARQEIAVESAELSKEKQKLNLEKKVKQFNKKVGKQLKDLGSKFDKILVAEKKASKKVHSALENDIFQKARTIFAEAKQASDTYKKKVKNPQVRIKSLAQVAYYLNKIIEDTRKEEVELKQAIQQLPNKKQSEKILKKLENALLEAETIRKEIQVLAQETQQLA